jgi:hypothetical protein
MWLHQNLWAISGWRVERIFGQEELGKIGAARNHHYSSPPWQASTPQNARKYSTNFGVSVKTGWWVSSRCHPKESNSQTAQWLSSAANTVKPLLSSWSHGSKAKIRADVNPVPQRPMFFQLYWSLIYAKLSCGFRFEL